MFEGGEERKESRSERRAAFLAWVARRAVWSFRVSESWRRSWRIDSGVGCVSAFDGDGNRRFYRYRAVFVVSIALLCVFCDSAEMQRACVRTSKKISGSRTENKM